MGITAAAVHLPTHRLVEKELAGDPTLRGYEALRLAWWDEDPLTLAIEAGLGLGDRSLGVGALYLALDERAERADLARRALGVTAPLVEMAGPDAGLEALVAARVTTPALVLAGGARLGGAGVALLLEPAGGIEVLGAATGRSDAGEDRVALEQALGALGGAGTVLSTSRPANKSGSRLSRTVGDAGAALAVLDLVGHLAREGGPCRVGSSSKGAGLALALGPGRLEVRGLDAPVQDTTLAAWRKLTETRFEPWAEAAQGAYVSEEEYEAEPDRRYGARKTGPGVVEAVTTVHAGPPGEFLRQHEAAGPYDVAIVGLDRGGRTIGQSAAPPGDLGIGMRVEPVLRRVFSLEGRWRYGLKWKPTL